MMSEVERYGRMGELGKASPALLKLYPAMTVYVLGDDFDRVTAERDALQRRLNAADQRIDELSQDTARLDALESNCWDVRFDSSPNGDAGDSSISIEVVGHWMDKPAERFVGENYTENLRAAIDQVMTAPAYPPARPEYPELDELLEREHQKLPMNAHVS